MNRTNDDNEEFPAFNNPLFEHPDVAEESSDSRHPEMSNFNPDPDISATSRLGKYRRRVSEFWNPPRRNEMTFNVNAFPEPSLEPPTTAPMRKISVENTTLTEVVTIYEKLKKGRDSHNRVFRPSPFKPPTYTQIQMDHFEAQQTVPITPDFGREIPTSIGMDLSKPCLDFNKYKNYTPQKYLYFSEATNLLQSSVLQKLAPNISQLLRAKNYWLNITDPSEHDFAILYHSYGVNDLTLSDIRERNTEEKLEVYNHYTFFSLRLMFEDAEERSNDQDVDFNILLFHDFIITIHYKQWSSIRDILGFLDLLVSHSHSTLSPDWVLFSCFIEISQDAQYMIDLVEPEILKMRVSNNGKSIEMSDVMRRNFDLELQIYSIIRFVKPKMKILRQIKAKCSKRLDKVVSGLLSDILDDLREMRHDLSNYNQILERSQDTFLAIVTSYQSREANEMGRIMKRISEIALVFFPVQAAGGFFGMNVEIPWQNDKYDSLLYFWIIVFGSFGIGLLLFGFRSRILQYNKEPTTSAKVVPYVKPCKNNKEDLLRTFQASVKSTAELLSKESPNSSVVMKTKLN